MFQPRARGRHEILKRDRQVYIPPLPTLTAKSLFHFNMISLLISNVAPEGAHIFYSVAKHSMFSSMSRTYCHISAIFIKLPSVSENQIFLCGDTSVWNFGRMSFFFKRSKEIFRDPRGNVQFITIFLPKTLQKKKKAKPFLPSRCVNIYKYRKYRCINTEIPYGSMVF